MKHFPANVTGCEITVNREKQRVVCCYHYQPHIKVFDLDMKPIRQMSGPEPDDAEYTIVHDNMLFFSEHTGINHYYFQSFHDSNNIFVKNRRNHADKSYGGVYIEKEKLTSEIWRLNWEGDIIGRYCAKRYDVIYVTYSIASNTIYLWLDANGEHALYKAKLD